MGGELTFGTQHQPLGRHVLGKAGARAAKVKWANFQEAGEHFLAAGPFDPEVDRR